MSTAETLSRVRYVRRKRDLVVEEMESWQRDHLHAMLCHEVQDVVRDVNRHFEDILRVDNDIRNCDDVDGPDFDRLESELAELMVGFVKLAGSLLTWVTYLEGERFDVEGAKQLRANLREARAMVEPMNDELPEGLKKLRDEALAEHRRGESIPGLRD